MSFLPQPPHFVQSPQQLFPRFLSRTHFADAKTKTTIISTISRISVALNLYAPPRSIPISRTANAAIQATAHCQNTTPTAHLRPSSLRMDATAATQGV